VSVFRVTKKCDQSIMSIQKNQQNRQGGLRWQSSESNTARTTPVLLIKPSEISVSALRLEDYQLTNRKINQFCAFPWWYRAFPLSTRSVAQEEFQGICYIFPGILSLVSAYPWNSKPTEHLRLQSAPLAPLMSSSWIVFLSSSSCQILNNSLV